MGSPNDGLQFHDKDSPILIGHPTGGNYLDNCTYITSGDRIFLKTKEVEIDLVETMLRQHKEMVDHSGSCPVHRDVYVQRRILQRDIFEKHE